MASTNLFLIGNPISHSFSPVLHNALYEKLDLPWHYSLANTPTEVAAKTIIRSRDYVALNVTSPYKPLAFSCAEEFGVVAGSAKIAQGVNLLVNRKGTILGFNLDGEGAIAFLQRTGCQLKGSSVAICGTGPTALAILYACAVEGADCITLFSRDKAHGKEVLQGFITRMASFARSAIVLDPVRSGCRTLNEILEEVRFRFASYEGGKEALSQASIIVNATPLGHSRFDDAPFATSVLHEGQTVLDCVYGLHTTTLVAQAKEAGCKAYDGKGMLVAQAALSVQTVADVVRMPLNADFDAIFTIMAKALRNELA